MSISNNSPVNPSGNVLWGTENRKLLEEAQVKLDSPNLTIEPITDKNGNKLSSLALHNGGVSVPVDELLAKTKPSSEQNAPVQEKKSAGKHFWSGWGSGIKRALAAIGRAFTSCFGRKSESRIAGDDTRPINNPPTESKKKETTGGRSGILQSNFYPTGKTSPMKLEEHPDYRNLMLFLTSEGESKPKWGDFLDFANTVKDLNFGGPGQLPIRVLTQLKECRVGAAALTEARRILDQYEENLKSNSDTALSVQEFDLISGLGSLDSDIAERLP